MRLRAALIFLLALTMLTACSSPGPSQHTESVYDPAAAVAYAQKYALERDPDCPVLERNCTNFVSQCLLAGGMAQDQPLQTPVRGERMLCTDSRSRWYCAGQRFSEHEPVFWSASTPFVRSTDFVAYWTQERSFPLLMFDNDLDGLLALFAAVEPGDLVLLCDPDDDPSHIGLITLVEEFDACYCGNTNDRLNLSVASLNPEHYPRIGIIDITT